MDKLRRANALLISKKWEELIKMRKNEDIKNLTQDKKRITQILYIIQYGNTNQYKIGITKNLNKRISELQVGSPYELRLVKIWTHTRREKIEEYERVIHRYLIKEGYQIRRDSEWFRLCKPILKLLLALNTVQEQNKIIEFIHKDLQ